MTVVVFPEGTRSVSGRLQPFKKGFFRLVADNPDVRILPVGETQASLAPVSESVIRKLKGQKEETSLPLGRALRFTAMHNNANLWPVNSKLLFPGTSYIMAGDFIYPEVNCSPVACRLAETLPAPNVSLRQASLSARLCRESA